MTDEYPSYRGLDAPSRPVWSVNHGKGKYVSVPSTSKSWAARCQTSCQPQSTSKKHANA
jgi:hypothetical protein